MAIVTANIIIDFISNNSSGCNNVCYGTTPGGPYPNCTIVNCTPGAGVPCQAIIPITVNTESCPSVTYYGYIESCCNEIGIGGQIPWSVTYVPDPTCKAIRFTCNNIPNCANTITGTICGTGGELTNVPAGDSFYLCYNGGIGGGFFNPANFSQYTYTQDPSVCCSTCQTIVAFSSSGLGNILQYIDCNGNLQQHIFLGATPFQFCALQGSYWSNSNNISFTVVNANTCTLP